MKRVKILTTIFCCFSALGLQADELEFRYDFDRDGCYSEDGRIGYNNDHIGECGYIKGEDFIGASLKDVDFRGAHIESIDWSDSAFENVSFGYATVIDTSFRRVKWVNGYLSGARFSYVDFDGAEISNVRLGASFYEAKFTDVSLADCNLSGSFNASVLRGVRMKNSYISGLKLISTTFVESVISGELDDEASIDFQLDGGEFSGNQISYAYLTITAVGQTFENNRLSNVFLSGTEFVGASLVGTSFSQSEFYGVNFTRSDMSGVTFDEETLDGEEIVFTQALYDENTLPFANDTRRAVTLGMYKKPY